MILTLFPTMNIKNKLFLICIYFFILRSAYAENLNDVENKFSGKITNRSKRNNTETNKSFYVNKKSNENSNSKGNSTNTLKLNEAIINKFNKRKNGDQDTTERKQIIRKKDLSRQKKGQTNTSFIIKSNDDTKINSKKETSFNQNNFRNKPQTDNNVKNTLERDDTDINVINIENNDGKKLYDNNNDINNIEYISSENLDYSSEDTSDGLLNMDDLYKYADEDLISDDITEEETIDNLFEDSMPLYNNFDKIYDKHVDFSLTKDAKKIDIDVFNSHKNDAHLKESIKNRITKNKNINDKTISSKNTNIKKKTTSNAISDNQIISKPNKTIKKNIPESRMTPLNGLNNGSTHSIGNKKSNVSKYRGNQPLNKERKENNNTNHKNKIDGLHNKGNDRIVRQNDTNNITIKEDFSKINTTKNDKNSISNIDGSKKIDKIVKDETKSIGEIININIAFNPMTQNKNRKLGKNEKKKHTDIRNISRKGKASRTNNNSAKHVTKNNNLSVNSFDDKVETDKYQHKNLENKNHIQKNVMHNKKGKHMINPLPDETANDINKNKHDISISIEVPKEMGKIKIPSKIVEQIKKGNNMNKESFIYINSQSDNGNDNNGENIETENNDTNYDEEKNQNDGTKYGTNESFIPKNMEVTNLNTENKLVIEKEKEDKNLERYGHEDNAENVEYGEHPLITKKKNIIKNSRKIYNLKLYNCSYIDDWDLNNEYIDEEGKLVKLSGYVFQNVVNSDSMPTANITDWKLKGSCDHDKYICGALKYMNNIYNKGERVIFDGKIYEATSDAYGNPKELANAWIDKTSDCYNF
ncbi:secreted ookinete protein, putative [Plasmodium berghei]|uniref:Secreted ookinete protein, putative n=2 Tax=Plasmodium berghei TaxID=5821 RepID=A0A509ASW0_PLABA|nr:secreted ookinete protein, putative [Plasmodium berghei ANKA]CXJ02473.1 secreted ookinete protein, putative [Plasmodium berghei]SCL98311.1 secreted ookinete protein, putative [Plasmodium berghei]SCM16807.1 secreted ookinete protein, putative [Plasmodium berghei]SCM18605.1 secreted ookinete protein, putative [Plasmodium berghei]SCN28040.1 secreted ookinete protein, putative [Plasmodium berghei]|eukprot:XP_034423691.1 secreted ookinete protein, putative [Plasmodium berghei ANKA]